MVSQLLRRLWTDRPEGRHVIKRQVEKTNKGLFLSNLTNRFQFQQTNLKKNREEDKDPLTSRGKCKFKFLIVFLGPLNTSKTLHS